MKNKILNNVKTRTIVTVCSTILIISTILIFRMMTLGGASKSLTLKLTPSTAVTYPAKDIEVTLSAYDFNGMSGIYGFLLEMQFDPAAFTFKEISLKQKNTPESTLSLQSNLAEDNRLVVLFFDNAATKPLNYLEEGDLIVFKFETRTNAAAGDYDFTLNQADIADNSAKSLAAVSFVDDSNKATVKIQALSVASIEFKGGVLPAPVTFVEGNNFAVVGEITVTYADGSTADVSITKEMCLGYNMNPAFDAGHNDTPQVQSVTVTWGSKTLNYDITVNKKAVSEISAIKAFPAKTTYLTGQSLDVSGMVVSVNYNNGTVSEVKVTADMVTGFNNAVAGTQTLTVTLDTKSISFNVEVISRAVVDKLIQDIQALNVAGLTLSDKETISQLNNVFGTLSAIEKAEVTPAEIAKLQAASDKITQLLTTTTTTTVTTKAAGTETGDKSLAFIFWLALPLSIMLLFVLVYTTKRAKQHKQT